MYLLFCFSNLSAYLVRQKNILILCQQILTLAPKLLNLPIKGCDSSTTAIGMKLFFQILNTIVYNFTFFKQPTS